MALGPRQDREPEGEQSAVSLKRCSKGMARMRPNTPSPPSLVKWMILDWIGFQDKSRTSGQETVQAQRLITARAQNSEMFNNTGIFWLLNQASYFIYSSPKLGYSLKLWNETIVAVIPHTLTNLITFNGSAQTLKIHFVRNSGHKVG